jgi:glycosyltransferase involved in cell wall biosynthesis
MNSAPPRPLVSVVIPSFRHEQFIANCLESIATQTYPAVEVILIDDASPDRSLDVADAVLTKYSSRFERILVLTNTVNRGAHFSLNRGLSVARGEYISFINSDDEYDRDRLHVMIDAMEKKGSGFGFSAVETIDEASAPTYRETLSFIVRYRPLLLEHRLPSLSWGFLSGQLTASTGNIVVSRSLADKVGEFADLKYCHDWDYTLRAIFFDEPVMVHEPLYRYRLHGGNSFRNLTEAAAMESEYVLSGYFRRVMTATPVNPLAPAPQNWPGMFMDLLELTEAKSFFERLYRPYRDYHRTVACGV